MTFQLHLYLEKFFVENALKGIPQNESIAEALGRYYGDTLLQVKAEPSGDTWKVHLLTSVKGFLTGNAQFRDDGIEFGLLGGITQ